MFALLNWHYQHNIFFFYINYFMVFFILIKKQSNFYFFVGFRIKSSQFEIYNQFNQGNNFKMAISKKFKILFLNFKSFTSK